MTSACADINYWTHLKKGSYLPKVGYFAHPTFEGYLKVESAADKNQKIKWGKSYETLDRPESCKGSLPDIFNFTLAFFILLAGKHETQEVDPAVQAFLHGKHHAIAADGGFARFVVLCATRFNGFDKL